MPLYTRVGCIALSRLSINRLWGKKNVQLIKATHYSIRIGKKPFYALLSFCSAKDYVYCDKKKNISALNYIFITNLFILLFDYWTFFIATVNKRFNLMLVWHSVTQLWCMRVKNLFVYIHLLTCTCLGRCMCVCTCKYK